MAQNPVFTITMSDGREMKGELYPDVAPQSVGNFIALANSGFYDGLTFHRVIPGFMIHISFQFLLRGDSHLFHRNQRKVDVRDAWKLPIPLVRALLIGP